MGWVWSLLGWESGCPRAWLAGSTVEANSVTLQLSVEIDSLRWHIQVLSGRWCIRWEVQDTCPKPGDLDWPEQSKIPISGVGSLEKNLEPTTALGTGLTRRGQGMTWPPQWRSRIGRRELGNGTPWCFLGSWTDSLNEASLGRARCMHPGSEKWIGRFINIRGSQDLRVRGKAQITEVENGGEPLDRDLECPVLFSKDFIF